MMASRIYKLVTTKKKNHRILVVIHHVSFNNVIDPNSNTFICCVWITLETTLYKCVCTFYVCILYIKK